MAQAVADCGYKLVPPPPELIVLGPPDIFRTNYQKQLCDRFRILKPWESPYPLEQFLQTHARNTRAMLCSGDFRHLGAGILSHLPSLGLLVTTSAGLNHIDLQECRRRGISVANASAIFSADVADLAVGLLIDVLRRISAANCFVKSGIWPAKSVEGPYPLATKGRDYPVWGTCFVLFLEYIQTRKKKDSSDHPQPQYAQNRGDQIYLSSSWLDCYAQK